MGLRANLKKTFGGGSSSTKKTSTSKKAVAELNPDEPLYTARTDIEYYKPNEIPRSKYKGTVDPLHAASLASYTFSNAFGVSDSSATGGRRRNRRGSDGGMSGTFSPGGTKSQSRMTSAAASRAASRANSKRPSVDIGSRLKTETRADSQSSDSSISSSSLSLSTQASRKEAIDTPSTSLSSQDTKSTPSLPELSLKSTKPAPPAIDSAIDVATINDTPNLTKQTTAHDTPFTLEELEKAMSRATMQPRDYDDEDLEVIKHSPRGRRKGITS